jgi:CelD/BcsL family acetyltransferase involved in cellulose biosynthesis
MRVVPTSIAAELQVEEITTSRALEELRPEWSRLWLRCARAAPFQTPEWLLCWWRHFGSSRPCALAVRCEGRLVALAPLFLWRDEKGLRRVLLIGTGISDRLDLLAEPAHEQSAAEAIVSWLSARRDQWDECDLQQLPRDSVLLRCEIPVGLFQQTSCADACPVLALPERAADLSETLPPEQWKKLQYYRRRAAGEGALQFERAEDGNFEELFEALLRLHASRWSARELPGMLADAQLQAFHREAAAELLNRGMLRLYAVRIGEPIVASLYGFSDGHRTYYYLGGFDPARKQLSPGLLVIGHAIEQAVREGCGTFDFLRGREAYKYQWGARDEPSFRRLLRRAGKSHAGIARAR